MPGLSIRAYARHREAAGLSGGTMQSVRKAIAGKRITQNADGTIDPERADQEWTQNTFAGATIRAAESQSTPRAVPPASPPQPAGEVAGDPVSTFLRARAVKETFAARKAQLEYEREAGSLIPTVKAAEYATTISAIVKDHLQARSDRLAPILAALDEEKQIHRLLRADDETVLRKLSKAISDAGL